MARAAVKHLRPVTAPPPTEQADLELVRTFAESLPAAYLECRDLMHNWLPLDLGRHRDGGYERTLRCSRCKARKVQHLDVDFRIIGSKPPQYPDGYLSEGLGRLDSTARAALRGVSVQRQFSPERRATKPSPLPKPKRKPAARKAATSKRKGA